MQHTFHMEPCKCIFPVDFLGGFRGKGNNDAQVLNCTMETDTFCSHGFVSNRLITRSFL